MPHPPIHLVAALDGAGWHPAAWREPGARPAELLTAGYWSDLVQEAERGLLDAVTLEDAFALQSDDPFVADDRTDRVRGRLDAVLVAARVAPTTRHIGFLPTAVVTHTEPFHLSKAIATLDYVSSGRAGVRVQVAARPDVAAHLGRRELPPVDRDAVATAPVVVELFDEAADYVEVLRRLWDSWEDDAEIRDAATGRFVDVDKLHYIDFEGRHFSVRGPSITPRPPQGQPLVAALGHAEVPWRLIGRSADVGFVTPTDAADAARLVAAVRTEQAAAGREAETVHVLGDLLVVLDDDATAAADRLARLDDVAGAPLRSDARVFTGTPAQLADLLMEWQRAGLTGFRLRPAVLPDDLEQVTRGLVPELQRRGAFRTGYEAATLRGLLGLGRPANRYATA
ncbi:LLM class flavin-dependent oxidoreductase [Klenkia taihuensis]|uniref:Flavin-dependent oxidoreductase, luciferase family (Includes alkanesulfonate monooxygenase SsuD and methylene tetrahydromethanopterin reductase) n=1 Tax=Klenkia taihuensis TaxID=1225127 RepID=A0A1I1R9B6_9ACTN|nr:LLM class flavin-dependent oxidoreductase [Klenkia taihuensis]GHE07116.1 FMNH2-utilizing oxygenase [Klenkia taihuensis]SFD30899.1 Flavin-dependent oxidoreductase, luciferase family (includes alkanesulfonate monooxygenase SsuD and methylene tetrahydromethanopterin reductase) [Klenkia taihuensis]